MSSHRNAEITEEDLLIFSQQEIRRFDISVDHLLVMRILECCCDGLQVGKNRCEGKDGPRRVTFRQRAIMSMCSTTSRGVHIVKRQWSNEELVEYWTLSSKELDLIGDSKTDHKTRGF